MKTTLINFLMLLMGILIIQLFTSCVTTCHSQQIKRDYDLAGPYLDYTIFDTYGEIAVATALPLCDDGRHILNIPDCGQYEPRERSRKNGERILIFCFEEQDFFCAMSNLNEATLAICQPSSGH